VEGQRERCSRRAAAPFDDADAQFPRAGLEREAQACRGRLARGLLRAEDQHAGPARLGRHRQPAQLLVAGLAKPGKQRAAGSRAQHLLRGPERVAPARRAHHGELREIDPGRRQRRRVRQVGRREPDDALAGAGKPRERRQRDLELTDAFLRTEDLGERSGRPAAARQLAVEGGVTRGNRTGNPSGRGSAPDGIALQEMLKGRHAMTVFIYSIGPGRKGYDVFREEDPWRASLCW